MLNLTIANNLSCDQHNYSKPWTRNWWEKIVRVVVMKPSVWFFSKLSVLPSLVRMKNPRSQRARNRNVDLWHRQLNAKGFKLVAWSNMRVNPLGDSGLPGWEKYGIKRTTLRRKMLMKLEIYVKASEVNISYSTNKNIGICDDRHMPLNSIVKRRSP